MSFCSQHILRGCSLSDSFNVFYPSYAQELTYKCTYMVPKTHYVLWCFLVCYSERMIQIGKIVCKLTDENIEFMLCMQGQGHILPWWGWAFHLFEFIFD